MKWKRRKQNIKHHIHHKQVIKPRNMESDFLSFSLCSACGLDQKLHHTVYHLKNQIVCRSKNYFLYKKTQYGRSHVYVWVQDNEKP